MRETDVVQACRLAASECGVILWRNNTGAYKDKNGRFVRYGLAVGSSDLIGVSKRHRGKMVALECKIPGWKPSGAAQIKHYNEQLNFINAVKDAGGIAGFVTCRDDVLLLLK